MTVTLDDQRVIDPEAPQYNATLVERIDQHESLGYFSVRFAADPTPFEAGKLMRIRFTGARTTLLRPYCPASAPRDAALGLQVCVGRSLSRSVSPIARSVPVRPTV